MRDKKLYVGYSTDLERRLLEHDQGRNKATKHRRPLKLIYYEAYSNIFEAKRREVYLKGGNGREQLKKQLDRTLKKIGYRHL